MATTKTTNEVELLYGQLVIGPAGSGKTSFCKAMLELLENDRQVIMVNLDPDNESIPFTPHIDIGELVRLPEVMQNESLGPNGAFLFCIDMLAQNFDWLYRRIEQEMAKAAKAAATKQFDNNKSDRLSNALSRKPYIIFDCPGQIELYTNYPAFKRLINRLGNGPELLPPDEGESPQSVS